MARKLTVAALVLAAPLAVAPAYMTATAQTDDDGQGFLESLIEDKLSSVGREVRITGFEGALSSKASLDTLTIADENGVWLTLRDAELDWNRSALLRGRLAVTTLSAGAIEVARKPIADPAAPSPEATPFALPDLPVAISIGTLSIDRVDLAQGVVGDAVALSVDGTASLADGEGAASVSLSRLDDVAGSLSLEGSYANATGALALRLDLAEGDGGMVTGLLNMPGAPDVRLIIDGSGTAVDFDASLALTVNEAEAMAGDFTLTAVAAEAEDVPVTRAFQASLDGDLSPLFAAEYGPFLGDAQALNVSGSLSGLTGVQLEQLQIRSAAMDITGAGALAADGWPTRLTLDGAIAAPAASGFLTIPGTHLRLGQGDLALDYDRAAGEGWQLRLSADQIDTPDMSIGAVTLTGAGTLNPEAQTVAGDLTLAATDLLPQDPDLATVLGTELRGDLGFDWAAGQGLSLDLQGIRGADYAVTGQAHIQPADGQFDLLIDGDLGVQAADLGRFAALAKRPLTGQVDLRVAGQIAPVSGAFDLTVTGQGRDLGAGIAQLDPLLVGLTELDIEATRDTSGLRLPRLVLGSSRAQIDGSADLRSGASKFAGSVALTDLADVVPGASGAAEVSCQASQSGDSWTVDASASGPGAAKAGLDGTFMLQDGVVTQIDGAAQLSADDLSPYAGVAGRPLSGSLTASASGSAQPEAGLWDGEVQASGRNLALGVEVLDQLLAGDDTLTLKARTDDGGTIIFDEARLTTDRLRAAIFGALGGASEALNFDISLTDLGLIAPGIHGPASLSGQASPAGQDQWNVSADFGGPAGIAASVQGQLAQDLSTADLTARGTAPLALANQFISPNLLGGAASFTLRLNGAPSLEALSGAIRSGDAQITLPALQMAISGIGTTVDLSGGQARLAARGTLASGGQVTVSGPIALSAPYRGDLAVTLDGARVTRPGLVDTTADGQVSLSGAMTSPAVNGTLTLRETEIRIPESFGGEDGAIDDLTDVNLPADVAASRARAGLTDSSGGGATASIPLDLTINAPSRVFVRGRGLDAEFGGALRLAGTASEVLPQGRFDLIRGRLDILGKRLTLTEGYVQLRGDFDPYLRVVATTRADDVAITVVIQGDASSPEVTFQSIPDLPEDQILSQLLFGKDLSEISALQALRLAAAVRTLAGKGGEGIVAKLRDGFGLDDLDVSTGENGAAEVTLGKYLSENIYTDVTVDSEGNSEVNLNFNITPDVTARGSLHSDGNSGIGIFFEKDY